MMKKFTLLVAMLLGFLTNSNAQIGVLEGFNSSTTMPAGWTNPNFYGVTATQACNGNSIRKNLYSSATTAVLTTPNYVGASNGTDVTFSFDYKIVNWSAATVATPAGWGNMQIQMSTDAGGAWTTVYTIDDTNHVVANTCANVSFTIPSGDVPSGSDLQFRFSGTWTAGDYYFYLDNIAITQETSSAPNCDAALTSPLDGAVDVQLFGNIAWSAATGVATGYNLTVGTSPGGSDVLATTDVGNVTGYALGTLTESTTYYVSIVPYNANGDASGCTEYSFTTRDPIAGDFCSGAVDLTLETSPLSGSTVGANNDNTPTCGFGNASPDVYYSILVPSGSTLTIQQTTNSYDSVVSMFYGDCDNQTAILCYDDPDTQINTWANTTGSDQTVYFVVDGYGSAGQSGTYTLEWSVIACSNATATYSIVSNCDVAEEFFVDVDVTDLGSATSLTITDNLGSAPQSVTATGVVQFGPYPNATLVIFTLANDQDASCTVTSPEQTQAVCPPNCDNAVVIAACDEDVVAAIPAGAGSWNVNACGFSTPGVEMVYSFTPAVDGVYSLEVVNATGGYVDYYYKEATGSCDASGWTCIDDNIGAGVDPIGTLTAGVEYLFLLDSEGTSARTHTFKITCPPTCTDATVAYSIVSNCDVAPQFFVDVNITDLGTATSLTVSDDQGSAAQNVTATGTVQFGPYDNGTNVIFTVANDQDATCVLTSAAQTQAVCPPDCANATVVECATDTLADFVAGPGAWNVNACGFSTPGVEKMYSFTAPADGDYSLQVSSPTGGYVDYYYKEASGSCDNTGWTCIDDIFSAGTVPLGTLTAGVEYLILLDSEGTTARSQTFKIICPLVCVEPTATFEVVSNCAVAAQFFVTANVTNLGSATSLTVSDNQASATQTLSAAGTVQFGPYANGTSVVLTLTNDQLTTCTLVSTAQTQTDCPPSCATLTTPANGATNVAFTTPGVISLAWTAPVTGPAPTNYTIMWGTSLATMTSLGTTANTAVNITNVPYNSTFYWSAVPNFTAGSVTGCTVFSFTTAGSPGYCLNGSQWPTATFVPTCTGTPQDITTGGWAGEYSRVTVTTGTSYTFTSSVATDFITIGDATGTTALIYGTTPLTWTSTVTGDIRFYTHLSDQCEVQDTDRTRSISCANLATDTFDNANFTYRPNPVVDILNLEYNKTITSVSVYNIVGQQVIAKTVNANMSQVDMSALPSGTYMVKVTSNNEVKTIKVVKE